MGLIDAQVRTYGNLGAGDFFAGFLEGGSDGFAIRLDFNVQILRINEILIDNLDRRLAIPLNQELVDSGVNLPDFDSFKVCSDIFPQAPGVVVYRGFPRL